MVDCYNEYAMDAAYGGHMNRVVANLPRPGFSPPSCCDFVGFILIILGTIFSIVCFILLGEGNDTGMTWLGIPAVFVGILCKIIDCYCEKECCFREDPPNTYPWSSSQINEIKAWLISQNVAVGSSEVQPLLQGVAQNIPNDFLLFERPRNKVNVAPLPFFTTDRDTHFAQSFRDSKFAGLIRDVSGELRAQGASISDRYCLTKVGSGFERVRNVPIMPEIDSVEVVVD